MLQNYTPEFKKKIVRLHLEKRRTINSITTEYGISKESVDDAVNFRKNAKPKAFKFLRPLMKRKLLRQPSPSQRTE